MAKQQNTFRAGLWSIWNFPAEGMPLAKMVRYLRGMMVDGTRPSQQALAREIRAGRWSRPARPCADHAECVYRLEVGKTGTVRAKRIGPNRWVLSFTA